MADRSNIQSPAYAKISHATAISLGLARGRMYRGAVNRCANLLVHYPEGCAANCAYCGLARRRPGAYEDKSFIHVDWPVLSLDRIILAIQDAPAYVERICISMITNGKCRGATVDMTRRLAAETALPVSILVAPTILADGDLSRMKEAGADKIGVALDLATPELFDRYRGRGVSGPHRWETYMSTVEQAIDIFGPRHVGAHLMVGMGETEEQMVLLMERLYGMGAVSHLFSFFAEEGSCLADRDQPPWSAYLRIQLARYFIEEGFSEHGGMRFNGAGQITDFGTDPESLNRAISRGTPFMTTGCLGRSGKVACNRPFGNGLPGVAQWNYPYPPNAEEIDLIRKHVTTYDRSGAFCSGMATESPSENRPFGQPRYAARGAPPK